MTKFFLPSSLTAALFLSSCGNYQSALDAPAAQRDAVAGAAIGGITGAIVGNQSGETRNGAIVGAALGGTAGYVVGEDKDRRWQQYNTRSPQQQQFPPNHRDRISIPQEGGQFSGR